MDDKMNNVDEKTNTPRQDLEDSGKGNIPMQDLGDNGKSNAPIQDLSDNGKTSTSDLAMGGKTSVQDLRENNQTNTPMQDLGGSGNGEKENSENLSALSLDDPSKAEDKSENTEKNTGENIELRLKNYLNAVFVGEKISADLIYKRQNLKKILLEKIEECKAENIAEDILFDTAVSRLPYEIPQAKTTEKRAAVKMAEQEKVDYTVVAKIISVALIVISVVLYVILAWINQWWLKVSPLAFLPAFALYFYYAINRLKWNFKKKRHALSPLYFTGMSACVCVMILYILYISLVAVPDLIIIATAFALLTVIVYQTLSMLIVKKASFAASLIIWPLISTLCYTILRRFLPEFKLVWLLFVAAIIIDGVLLAATLLDKQKS